MIFSLASLSAVVTSASPMNLWDVDHSIESRSISAENLTGEPGKGGRSANHKGPGRKGSPSITLSAGEEVTLANIEGPGVIRHIWMTCAHNKNIFEDVILEFYWDGSEYPQIQMPIGPFFGLMNGEIYSYQSAVHSVHPKAGMNNFMPMPFKESARIVARNESHVPTPLFYSINYTLGEDLESEVGQLHGCYILQMPTTPREDMPLMPKRSGGSGRFLGAIVGIDLLEQFWWGEGEFKFYMDGDTDYPTIVGTGAEDYFLQSWGSQESLHLYGGCNMDGPPAEVGDSLFFYRWHIPDPIYWKESGYATIQQMAHSGVLSDRSDNYRVASFWYEATPSQRLPARADLEPFPLEVVLPAPTAGVDGKVEFEHLEPVKLAGGFDILKQGKHPVWSGDGQYLIRFNQPGDAAQFIFRVRSMDAVSDVIELGLTAAPDFGKIRVFVNDQAATDVDLYKSGDFDSYIAQFPKELLKQGDNEIRFEVIGKNAESTNYYAGLDYLSLTGKVVMDLE